MQIFLSTHNNQTDEPISTSPFYCVSLVFIIVVVFVFVLFGVTLHVYGTRCLVLKSCCKNKFALF
jgi:hypothetical protein